MTAHATSAHDGTVTRVNGPLVETEGLTAATLAGIVEVGGAHLLGEITALRGEVATVQMYEYTGGITAGAPAHDLGRALSVPLGPGLLGGVFDGLLRPLRTGPDLLPPGWAAPSLGPARRWSFDPTATVGDVVEPGAVLGTVQETEAVAHRIVVPPGWRGELSDLRGPGDLGTDDALATIGGRSLTLTQWWPVRRPRPVRARLRSDAPLRTGQRVIDLLFPVARGGTAVVPGGFGTGKTMLLQQIAKWCDADVIVYVGCGERGNEMADLLEDFPQLEDPRTGRSLLERTVIIVNTSNMPVMAREASIHSGITVAEHYRDMGYDTVVIADSTSRWAEALREFATRSGELPAEEGYPANLASALAAFYERAGRVRTLGGADGSTTIIGAVSPPGGDKTEPVTSHSQRFVRCFWSLDRDLAAARHYPAVSWSGSFSRDGDALAAWHVRAGDARWPGRRADVVGILGEADELQAMVQLVGRHALPDQERITLLAAHLIREGLLQQNALSAADAYSSPAKDRALCDAILAIHDRCRELLDRGVPASLLEEVDMGPILRAREQVTPDAPALIAAVRDAVLDRLEATA
jgi:V/A-type H+-transporting ATPase subunit A